MTATIRRYRDSDRAAVYEVCVETADAARGVRGRYSTDDLVPDTVAGPYLFLEPEHAYVLDNGERAVGYVIGTASTPDFVAAYQERWLPRLRVRYQPLSGPPVTEEEHRLEVMFHPERWLLPELAPHPAHLHINLLAGYRGSGHGRELLSTFLASVAAAGARSCYLGVRQENVSARRFYAKLGWRPVEVRGVEPGTYLAHPTGEHVYHPDIAGSRGIHHEGMVLRRDMRLFVPADFAVPGGLTADEFRLEPLGPEHNAADYAAWTASIGHIQATPGFAGTGWPHEMSLAENLRDLERHAQDFAERRGFTYTVLSTSTGEVIGCVYIYPPSGEGPGGADAGEQHAAVSSWVRADHAALDPVVYHAVRAWLERDWPFRSIEYAPRA